MDELKAFIQNEITMAENSEAFYEFSQGYAEGCKAVLKHIEDMEKTVPAAVTLPETSRVELDVLYPEKDGESASDHTTRLLSHAKEHRTNRQCSIGWHEECSEKDEGEFALCNCLCHAEGAEVYSVEGHAEDGVVTVIRAERGAHYWPPQEGEPATMWAWWVRARSETEAAVQGATKERNRLTHGWTTEDSREGDHRHAN